MFQVFYPSYLFFLLIKGLAAFALLALCVYEMIKSKQTTKREPPFPPPQNSGFSHKTANFGCLVIQTVYIVFIK